MPNWEETKRAAQTAFIGVENGFDVHESIAYAYRQIRITGHISPAMEEGDLTQQIAEDSFRQPGPDQDETLLYLNRFPGREPEPEQGMELER